MKRFSVVTVTVAVGIYDTPHAVKLVNKE